MEHFADAFSKYWFVFALAIIVGTSLRRDRSSLRRRIVGNVLLAGSGLVSVLGIVGMITRMTSG